MLYELWLAGYVASFAFYATRCKNHEITKKYMQSQGSFKITVICAVLSALWFVAFPLTILALILRKDV